MINEVIEDILRAEADAEAVIEGAKEQSKLLMQKNKAEIELMYSNAQIQLKTEVEKIISDAEADAAKGYESDIKRANEQAQAMADKSKEKFLIAVKKVEAALKSN